MSENHWKSFQTLPEDGIPIRVKVPPAKTLIPMIRHGKNLKYQIHPDDSWQGVGVFTECVFSHGVWCYDSNYHKRKSKKISHFQPVYRSHHCPNGNHNYYVMHFYYTPLKRLIKYVKCLDCGFSMPYCVFERTLGKNMSYRLSTAL